MSETEPGWSPEFVRARLAAERRLTEAGHGTWFGAFGTAAQPSPHPGLGDGMHGLTDGNADTHMIVADPDNAAISVYRSVGSADAETQTGCGRQP